LSVRDKIRKKSVMGRWFLSVRLCRSTSD